MRNTIILGVLLILGLAAVSGTETVSGAGAQQATSVAPKTSAHKSVSPPKDVRPNPSVLAVNDIVNAAQQMAAQCPRIDKAIATLSQDTALWQNPDFNSKVQALKGKSPCPSARDFLQRAQELKQTLLLVLKQGQTK